MFCFSGRFSPRTWRCFRTCIRRFVTEAVFSTHVEVFPQTGRLKKYRMSFLHARGGVSCPNSPVGPLSPFSPRTWRCFLLQLFTQSVRQVFSTHVEVFLRCYHSDSGISGFLHARGGVSCETVYVQFVIRFSPRTWRCFFF